MSMRKNVSDVRHVIWELSRRIWCRTPFINKCSAELSFWKSRYKRDKGLFDNSQYRTIMLAMAGEQDDDFVNDKIIADFGCGPRGSLEWAKKANLRIGIDILADRYIDLFPNNLLQHNMIYLKSTEKVIPMPSDSVDIMFSLNALDHVDCFNTICDEILRVIKPGGLFIFSINIEGHKTRTEPQNLNQELIKQKLMDFCTIQSYRLSEPGPAKNMYKYLIEGCERYREGKKGFLWVRGFKK